MFDLFRGIRDDNERDEGGPRIVFANLRRPSRPILSEQGYAVFSATTFSIWTLLVFTIWVFRIEVSPSQDTVTSIAGSSVELAALSLAVLGILHELNKEDRWFKLGLFLVSIFFACVVFSGFFLSITWCQITPVNVPGIYTHYDPLVYTQDVPLVCSLCATFDDASSAN